VLRKATAKPMTTSKAIRAKHATENDRTLVGPQGSG
jgi:hypothetical protein